MNSEKLFIDAVDEVVNSNKQPEVIAEILHSVDVPELTNAEINTKTLASFVKEFQFDWDNEAYDNLEDFLSEAISKLRQIVSDIKSGNKYKEMFSAELAYSRVVIDDYSYQIVTKNMTASTLIQAKKELDEIKVKAPKQHPKYTDYTLEDVQLKFKIVDDNNSIVIGDKYSTPPF